VGESGVKLFLGAIFLTEKPKNDFYKRSFVESRKI